MMPSGDPLDDSLVIVLSQRKLFPLTRFAEFSG